MATFSCFILPCLRASRRAIAAHAGYETRGHEHYRFGFAVASLACSNVRFERAISFRKSFSLSQSRTELWALFRCLPHACRARLI